MIENFTPKFTKRPIKIVGCGLAGAEVALILANNGFDVHIFDNGNNKPKFRFDYYDKYQTFLTENMRYELECLDSPIFSLAKRFGFNKFGYNFDEVFMEKVKEELSSNSRIQIFDANIDTLSDVETTVIATGHNTSKDLISELESRVGYFSVCYYQPEEVVIDAKSVDLDSLHFASPNVCYLALTKAEYDSIYELISKIDKDYQLPKDLEDEKQISIESLARRGYSGLRNAILRPHFDGKSTAEEKPYASLKMRYDKSRDVLFLEEFFSAFDEREQDKILRLMRGLKNCEILRYSKILRKTFLKTPTCINENLQICSNENIYVCGGFVGTEGSFESLLMANYCAYSLICQLKMKFGTEFLKEKTCIGMILNGLLKKSVINFRLFGLKYAIMNEEDYEMKHFDEKVEMQKSYSKTQIDKFKEKFYGKYF